MATSEDVQTCELHQLKTDERKNTPGNSKWAISDENGAKGEAGSKPL